MIKYLFFMVVLTTCSAYDGASSMTKTTKQFSFKANSEPLFGEYELSAAVDASVCPKKLLIKEKRPFQDIPNKYTLPVRNLVFDGKACAPSSSSVSLTYDVGGDSDGSTLDPLPQGTCFNTSVAQSAWFVVPYILPNGTYIRPFDDEEPYAQYEVNGGFDGCTFCQYRKPFSGPPKTGFVEFAPWSRERCAGRKILSPFVGSFFKKEPRYFVNIRCKWNGNLKIRGGVYIDDGHLIKQGARLKLSVKIASKVFAVESFAHCKENPSNCTDWRRSPSELIIPKADLKGMGSIIVLNGNKVVSRRSFVAQRECS